MQIGNVDLCEYDREYKCSKVSKGERFNYEQSQELESDESRMLGIGFLRDSATGISYGMSASLAMDYSKDNPVIEVSVTKGHNNIEKYYINIKEVNPFNATEIEMFALCNYADANGMGTGGTFGSWQTLNYYRRNADFNGNFVLTNTTDLCFTFRQNWISMVSSVMNIYNEAGLYEQGMEGSKLLDLFQVSGSEVSEDKVRDGKNYIQIIHNRIEEIYEKIVSGETQPSIAIGAGEFTEEEWDKLIQEFDKVQEEFRKEVEDKKDEEVKKSIATESLQEDDEKDVVKEADIQALVSQSTTCTYPSSEDDEKQGFYITCYTEDGIYCKGPGQNIGDSFLWVIKFDDIGQYSKVMKFINKFDPNDNLRFVSHKSFWDDFLNDRIDEDDFVNFYKNAKNTLGREAPEKVMQAWIESALEVGSNGFGMAGNGMLTHISQMMIKRLNNLMKNGIEESKGILGDSVESAIMVTEQALYDLEHPLANDNVHNDETQQQIESERNFYHTFLDKLNKLVKEK